MMAERKRRRAAITVALVIGLVVVAALLVWVASSVFAGDVLQCYTPRDDRTYTPVCP